MTRQSMAQLSSLEQELELELEGAADFDSEADDDKEAADDAEWELDDDAELEVDEDAELESALEEDRERTYGDRLADLASREFENPRELEVALSEVLDDMEREYFFGKIGKFISKAGKSLVKRGMKLAKNLPAAKVLEGVSKLARGNLKGLLGSLVQAGLAGAIPGGAMLGPLFQSLTQGGGGFGKLAGALQSGLGGDGAEQEHFHRLAEIGQNAFEELASRLNERADDPLEAARLAQASFESAVRRSNGKRREGGRHTRHVVLRPGQRLVVTVRR